MKPVSKQARTIPVDLSSRQYQRILSGPPDNMRLKAGMVNLAPGEAVGRHSTGEGEELLVVLCGQGEMIIEDGVRLPIGVSQYCYCPPQTGHDVINTGTGLLQYVYIVTKVK